MYEPLNMILVSALRAEGDKAIEAQMEMLERQFVLWFESSEYEGE